MQLPLQKPPGQKMEVESCTFQTGIHAINQSQQIWTITFT